GSFVTLTSKLSNDHSGKGCTMAFAVSGSTTVSASDVQSLNAASGNANDPYRAARHILWPGPRPAATRLPLNTKLKRTPAPCRQKDFCHAILTQLRRGGSVSDDRP